MPNHMIIRRHLLDIFYKALNAKVVADTITSDAFMSLRWEHAYEIVYQIKKINQRWNTRETDNSFGT